MDLPQDNAPANDAAILEETAVAAEPPEARVPLRTGMPDLWPLPQLSQPTRATFVLHTSVAEALERPLSKMHRYSEPYVMITKSGAFFEMENVVAFEVAAAATSAALPQTAFPTKLWLRDGEPSPIRIDLQIRELAAFFHAFSLTRPAPRSEHAAARPACPPCADDSIGWTLASVALCVWQRTASSFVVAELETLAAFRRTGEWQASLHFRGGACLSVDFYPEKRFAMDARTIASAKVRAWSNLREHLEKLRAEAAPTPGELAQAQAAAEAAKAAAKAAEEKAEALKKRAAEAAVAASQPVAKKAKADGAAAEEKAAPKRPQEAPAASDKKAKKDK